MATSTMKTGWSQVKSSSQEGATAVEYGIMVALIAVVIIGAVAALGTSLFDTFDCTADTVAAAEDECTPDP